MSQQMHFSNDSQFLAELTDLVAKIQSADLVDVTVILLRVSAQRETISDIESW